MIKQLSFFLFLIVCNSSFYQEKKPIETIKEPVFKFHPNPVEDNLFIVGTNKIISIEFIDELGNIVLHYQFNKSIIRIDLSELKSGIYLLKVVDIKNRQDIKKIVVK